MAEHDAVVVGSGPNGLAAAVVLARAGMRVHVVERADTIGGGARTQELTLPGYLHDVCSAVHPMAVASPFFREFELERRVRFAVPDISYGHPLDGGRGGVAHRDIDRTAAELGPDGAAWRRLLAPLVEGIDGLAETTGGSLLGLPSHPVTIARLGLRMLEQGGPLWNARFREEVAPAMLTGVAAHAISRMPSLASTGVALVLAAHAHAGGWAVPIGGSQQIVEALADDLRAHGGSLETGREIASLDEVADADVVMLDVTPRGLRALAGDRLPARYARALDSFRYGDGVAKLDLALSEPVPWTHEPLRSTPTLHVGGSRRELARGEAQVAAGHEPDSPYVLLSQPGVVDDTRAPEGRQTLWAYCHVPAGSTADMTEPILSQIERFAPGFRDTVLASRHVSAAQMSDYNPNYVGGDISAGALDIPQLLRRPVLTPTPWRTPVRGAYLCSSSTPPGTGVHGMSGFHAARVALADLGLPVPALGVDATGPRPASDADLDTDAV